MTLTPEEQERLHALETEALDTLLSRHCLDFRDYLCDEDIAEYDRMVDKMGQEG